MSLFWHQIEAETAATATEPAPLQAAINRYVGKGYRVVSQTETAAQLVRPKRFSVVWAILTALVFYLPYYWFVKRDKTVYLTVDADGRVAEQ